MDPAFGVVVANLLTTSEVAVTRQRGLEELLVKLPAVAAAGASAVDEDGARFGMAVTFFEPLPCTAGYGGTVYRNGLDTSAGPAVNSAARCTSSPAPASTSGAAPTPQGRSGAEAGRTGLDEAARNRGRHARDRRAPGRGHGGAAGSGRRLVTARTRRLGGWAVLLVAALVCGLGAWSYGQARGDESLAYAKARTQPWRTVDGI